jgi:hypothetical protein
MTSWKIDRRISIALIISLLVQIASALIWATQLDARVSHMEQQVISNNGLNEKFARLDERLDDMKQNLDGIKHQLDQLTDHLLKP